MFNVRLEKFQGPLNLLLTLIEEQKLDISEVSIARVADDYLEYVRSTQDISLESLAEFVSIASKIILIKSRFILPTLEITPGEEKEISDLAEQLRHYKKFKEAAGQLAGMLGEKKIMLSREYMAGVANIFSPPQKLKLPELKKTFKRIIEQIVLPEKLAEEAVREIVTMEQKIEELKNSLRERIEVNFSELSRAAKDKLEVIVSFLAMLEMVKQKLISVEQLNLFEEIKIKKF